MLISKNSMYGNSALGGGPGGAGAEENVLDEFEEDGDDNLLEEELDD
jgi:hypothetical protein